MSKYLCGDKLIFENNQRQNRADCNIFCELKIN